jgi:hypothetical protein
MLFVTGNTLMGLRSLLWAYLYFFVCKWCSYLIENTHGPPRPVTGIALLVLYVNYVRTSQKTRLWASTACYGDIFTFLYVNYLRASQKTRLWASTACYGNIFTVLCVNYLRASQKTRLWASTACYGYFFTFLYVNYLGASQKSRLWASTACYGYLYLLFTLIHISFRFLICRLSLEGHVLNPLIVLYN